MQSSFIGMQGTFIDEYGFCVDIRMRKGEEGARHVVQPAILLGDSCVLRLVSQVSTTLQRVDDLTRKRPHRNAR